MIDDGSDLFGDFCVGVANNSRCRNHEITSRQLEATNSDNSAGHQVNSEIHIIRVANMEDRHSISEPRPVFCRGNSLPPVWEIDVVRDGTVVIDTFKLDNEVLPPRRNKKGKVVWRLPDSVEKLVGPVRFLREELGQFEN